MKTLLFFLLCLGIHAAPKKIEIYELSKESFQKPISLVGTIKAHREAMLTAQSSGLLSEIRVHEGARVKKGQILAIIDVDSHLRHSVRDAEVSVQNKQKRLERVKKLQASGDMSLQELEEAQSDYAEASKNLHRLKHELAQTEMRAPFDGECGVFRVQAGSQVQSGTPVVAVYDSKALDVTFSVSEDLLKQIKVGQKIEVQGHGAMIKSLERRLDSKSHLALARACLDQCSDCVIGAKVAVLIKLSSLEQLSVPTEAVFFRNGQSYVYKIVDGKAILTAVQIGERAKKRIAIIQGLQAGDHIVLRGQNRILDHDDVIY